MRALLAALPQVFHVNFFVVLAQSLFQITLQTLRIISDRKEGKLRAALSPLQPSLPGTPIELNGIGGEEGYFRFFSCFLCLRAKVVSFLSGLTGRSCGPWVLPCGAPLKALLPQLEGGSA